MRRHIFVALTLGLLLLAAASCNWPLDEPTSQTADVGRSTISPLPTATRSSAETGSAATQSTVDATTETPTISASSVSLPADGLFVGRSVRFDLPDGYRVLEGDDGGCFIYAESTPGFLILYPTEDDELAHVTQLLSSTSRLSRTETPLEADVGGLTFTGVFGETGSGSRLFLAAAEGWGLVVQAPADGWHALASDLNQVLLSTSFEEEAR